MFGKENDLTQLQHIAILVPAVAKSCKPTLRLATLENRQTNKKALATTGVWLNGG